MTFKWIDFIDIASHLNDDKGATLPEEAAYRSAVNRAYYGAYGHSTSYAIKYLGFRPTGKGKDHKRVRDQFTKAAKINPKMADIASDLEDLHIWRKKCDYHNAIIDKYTPNQMAVEAIDNAHEIVNILL